MIILERDGSLHHYPSDDPHHSKQASVSLSADQVGEPGESSIIDKVLDFTFDVLGISNLEMRVYENQKR